MARLKECADCGHMVSKSADACPNCGKRFTRRWDEIGPFTQTVLWIPVVLILLAVLGQCSQ